MAGSAKAVNDAISAMITAINEFNGPQLMSSGELMPPIEQDPVEAIDCQKLTLAINTLQDLAIKHCPGV
jgi:hypothetical protein